MPHNEQKNDKRDHRHPVHPIEHFMEVRFGVTRPREVPMERPGLTRKLTEALRAPFVLVAAPLGYGKSTLLAQWESHQKKSDAKYPDQGYRRPFAVVALDHNDNDPISFWSAVIHSVIQVCPGVPEARLTQSLRTTRPDVEAVVLPGLITEIDRNCPQLVLALDNYQEITEPECHEQVDYLLKHLPPQSCLILSTRTDPPLSLARLRTSGNIIEIRLDDLRFTRAEVAQVISNIGGHQLDEADLDDLMDRTEGWPAVVYLTARLLGNQPNPSIFLRYFGGNNRYVVDYLEEEILRHLPGEVQRFLARTAILDRFTAELCDAVTGTVNSADLLDGLERSNLFLVPLDGVRTWYRYHQLFGQALREQLARTEPGAIAVLHQKASSWYERSGDPGRAIEHALAAGDTARATGLIAHHWARYVYQGKGPAVGGWLSAFGEEGTGRSPLTAICAAWLAALSGERLTSQRWLKTAEQSGHHGPLPDGMQSVRGAVVLYQATFGFGGLGEMLAAAHSAAELHTDPKSPWYAQARVALGFGYYLAGDVRPALRPLEQAAEAAAEFPVLRILALSALSLVVGHLGRAAQSADLSAAAQGLAQTQGLTGSNEITLAQVALAAVLVREGHLIRARQQLECAVQGRRAIIGLPPWPTVAALVPLARVALTLGDRDTVRALLDEAGDLLEIRPDGAEQVRAALAEIERRLSGAEHPPAITPQLTDREQAVLRLLQGSLPLREVAAQLFVTVNTVKSHTRLIYRKLGVSSRPEAVRRARELGLL